MQEEVTKNLNKKIEEDQENKKKQKETNPTISSEYYVFKDKKDEEAFMSELRNTGGSQETNSKSTLSVEQIKMINADIRKKKNWRTTRKPYYSLG